jgi:hypothetical protein
MADVGDGLCVTLHTVFGDLIQIDCGSQDWKIAYEGLERVSHNLHRTRAFILSHFHVDHYNGLLYISQNLRNSPFSTREVYFPRIPEFKDRGLFLNCLFSMNMRVFGQETGVRECDFLNCIKKINNGVRFGYDALYSGKTVEIGSSVFEVVWPPAVIDDERTLSAMRKAIEDFQKALDADEETRRLYEYVKKSSLSRAYLEEQYEREEFSRYYNDDYPDSKSDEKGLPDVVVNANKSLKKAANHMSLALFEDNRFLFLGDLEIPEIREVVNHLRSEKRVNFQVFVTPHHGTHWHDSLRQVRCNYSLVSNGRSMCSKIKLQFKEISQEMLATFVNGDIRAPNYPARYFW